MGIDPSVAMQEIAKKRQAQLVQMWMTVKKQKVDLVRMLIA